MREDAGLWEGRDERVQLFPDLSVDFVCVIFAVEDDHVATSFIVSYVLHGIEEAVGTMNEENVRSTCNVSEYNSEYFVKQ